MKTAKLGEKLGLDIDKIEGNIRREMMEAAVEVFGDGYVEAYYRSCINDFEQIAIGEVRHAIRKGEDALKEAVKVRTSHKNKK